MVKDSDKSPQSPDALRRRRAEEKLRKTRDGSPPPTGEEASRILHELQVHQIELEMQNDELRNIQKELEASRDQYLELYDFAPIGYLTLDANGQIRRTNRATSDMFGRDPQRLVNKPLTRFIADDEGKTIFARHLEKTLQNTFDRCCEIRLTGKEGIICGQLRSLAVNSGTPEECILTSIIDITESHELTDQLQKAHSGLEDLVAERTRELTESNQLLTQEIEERKLAETGAGGW